MSTCDSRTRPDRSGLVVPAACVLFGVAYLVIGIAKDNVGTGVAEFAIMVVFAAALVLGRRRSSEPAALLTGDHSDERRAQIQLKAAAVTGTVLTVCVVAGLFWSLAAGNSYAGVFVALAAVGGGTMFAATTWYSRHN